MKDCRACARYLAPNNDIAIDVVTLETGLTITTPLFVVAGDKVIVNTDRGTYVSRA